VTEGQANIPGSAVLLLETLVSDFFTNRIPNLTQVSEKRLILDLALTLRCNHGQARDSYRGLLGAVSFATPSGSAALMVGGPSDAQAPLAHPDRRWAKRILRAAITAVERAAWTEDVGIPTGNRRRGSG